MPRVGIAGGLKRVRRRMCDRNQSCEREVPSSQTICPRCYSDSATGLPGLTQRNVIHFLSRTSQGDLYSGRVEKFLQRADESDPSSKAPVRVNRCVENVEQLEHVM